MSVHNSMDDWYQSSLGQRLSVEIGQALSDLLPKCFGYYGIQLSCPFLGDRLIHASRVRHRFILDTQNSPDVLGQFEQLPIANDSVDLVISVHSLAYSKYPHALLREIDRILVPEGKLIIIEMNPLSFWGARFGLQAWLEKMPWTGKLFTSHRLSDWLTLLGFKKKQLLRVHYDLPFELGALHKASIWLNKALKRWLPFVSAVNILVFEKSLAPLTPVKSLWKQGVMGGSTVAVPYAGRRQNQHRQSK